jgi:hypothetical protein
MAATLTGISTIRASRAETRLIHEFDNLQNVHSSVWQTLMGVNTGAVKQLMSKSELPRHTATSLFYFTSFRVFSWRGSLIFENKTKKKFFDDQKKIKIKTFSLSLSLTHTHTYDSSGIMAGLCIMHICGLRVLQLHHDESGE